MAKVRVYELAKELGVESKTLLAHLKSQGEFVRSASSTIEPPVVRKIKETFPAELRSGGTASPAAPQVRSGALGAPHVLAGSVAGRSRGRPVGAVPGGFGPSGLTRGSGRTCRIGSRRSGCTCPGSAAEHARSTGCRVDPGCARCSHPVGTGTQGTRRSGGLRHAVGALARPVQP